MSHLSNKYKASLHFDSECEINTSVTHETKIVKVPMTKPKTIFQISIFVLQYIYILDNVLYSMPRFREDYEDMWDQE